MGNIFKFDYSKYEEALKDKKIKEENIKSGNTLGYKVLTDNQIVTRLCDTVSDPKIK